MHEAGFTGRAIAAALGITPPTVSYHLRRLGYSPQPQRRVDWKAVQSYYDEGHSLRECIERFGFSTASWYAARRRGEITPRPAGMPIEQLLAGRRNRTHVKLRLQRLGLLAEHCEDCGLKDWRGRPLSLELHHVNGDATDHRLGNLRMLCPNCHSQSDSWGGRNRRRKRAPPA